MVVEIAELDAVQKDILDNVGEKLADLGLDLRNCAKKGAMEANDVKLIRSTVDELDDLLDSMAPENKAIFEFIQDGPLSKEHEV